MRGAYLLCGLLNAVIIDIGGTTSDAGCTVEGFPRQASSEVRVSVIFGIKLALLSVSLKYISLQDIPVPTMSCCYFCDNVEMGYESIAACPKKEV